MRELEEESNYLVYLRHFITSDNCPHIQKVNYLVKFQDDLLRADIERKENRSGMNEILRMTGSLT